MYVFLFLSTNPRISFDRLLPLFHKQYLWKAFVVENLHSFLIKVRYIYIFLWKKCKSPCFFSSIYVSSLIDFLHFSISLILMRGFHYWKFKLFQLDKDKRYCCPSFSPENILKIVENLHLFLIKVHYIYIFLWKSCSLICHKSPCFFGRLPPLFLKRDTYLRLSLLKIWTRFW